MITLGIFCLVFSFAAAKTFPRCTVSDWSDWSECKGRCHQVKGHSYDAGPAQLYDVGRVQMQWMMEEKARQWAKLDECAADGSCPELSGFIPDTYNAQCIDGMAGKYPCRNIHLSSFTDFVNLGSSRAKGNDIWGWHDGDEDYAIVGLTTGTSFVRITDPENPETLGFLPTHTVSSTWRDMKVVNDHAYIVSEAVGHGMQVFDLTRLRGLTHNPSNRFTVDKHYPKVSNSHNIASNPETNTVFIIGATRTGFRYETCGGGGIHMIDVSDPKNPVFDGCYSDDGYSHDIECVIYRGPDSRYTGHEICFGYNENTLTIVDITDRSNPVQLSRTGYTGYAYTHQGWLTSDHRWALLDDELDESNYSDKRTKTYIWNVEDLHNPINTEIFYATETSIDHNLYIYPRHNGDWVFQSNYEAGLRLLHFDTTSGQLTEYGYFDVYPQRTTANFQGTWSNYPFGLKNGSVALNSIDYGFFMVQPDWDAIDQELAAKKAYGERQSYRKILSFNEGALCPKLSRVELCDNVAC